MARSIKLQIGEQPVPGAPDTHQIGLHFLSRFRGVGGLGQERDPELSGSLIRDGDGSLTLVGQQDRPPAGKARGDLLSRYRNVAAKADHT